MTRLSRRPTVQATYACARRARSSFPTWVGSVACHARWAAIRTRLATPSASHAKEARRHWQPGHSARPCVCVRAGSTWEPRKQKAASDAMLSRSHGPIALKRKLATCWSQSRTAISRAIILSMPARWFDSLITVAKCLRRCRSVPTGTASPIPQLLPIRALHPVCAWAVGT